MKYENSVIQKGYPHTYDQTVKLPTLINNTIMKVKLLAGIFILVSLSLVIYWMLSYHRGKVMSTSRTELKKHMISGILLDTTRLVPNSDGYDNKDTIWHANVTYVDGKPIDTEFIAPCFLPKNGREAEYFFGTEEEIMAYAQRKHHKTFCYIDSVGINLHFFINLKEDQNYNLLSARFGLIKNAIAKKHKNGWSRINADMGSWLGDTLVIGERIGMITNANGIVQVKDY